MRPPRRADRFALRLHAADEDALPPPIVMVHGAFCGGWTFERFRTPFEAAGHRVIAPELAGREGALAPVAGVSMRDYAAMVAAACEAAGEPPILLGHSLGGLLAQMAATRARVRALVLLAPSHPWGLLPASGWEWMAAGGPWLLGPYWASAVDPDPALARHYIFDRLPSEAGRIASARLRPESGRAMWETLNWWLDPAATTRVERDRVAAPVLALVGEHDRIHPPATVDAIARRLRGECRVMAGMSHWLPGEPGWERVAARCLQWLEALA